MRFYGRITLCGEYLMHGNNSGCIFKSKLFLQDGFLKLNENNYRRELDSTIQLLQNDKFSLEKNLYGTLPLGYGYAGSTILSCLKLADIDDIRKNWEVISRVDTTLHGFSPSGLDYHWILNQEQGFYSKNHGWKRINFTLPDYMIVIFPKEKKANLESIQKKMILAKNFLLPINDDILTYISKHGSIPHSELYEYACKLSSAGVYSTLVEKVIDKLLSEGITAKGIGGLYDKAVLITRGYANFEMESIENFISMAGGRIVEKSINVA